MINEVHFWVGFHVLLVILLYLDLKIFSQKSDKVNIKKSLLWGMSWVCLSLLFNVLVYYLKGEDAALEFFTGYLIEKSLSIDNILLFVVIFSFFKTPQAYQHKGLFWGIVGAFVLRLGLILLGVALIESFYWMAYVFGAFLCYTGIKFAVVKEKKTDFQQNFLLRLTKDIFPVLDEYHDGKFFVKKGGMRFATPLFLVLVLIISCDIVFALDSIPAIFAITEDPFIIYTSNVFALLGLRSLFFVLSYSVEKLHYIKTGLGLVLLFVGTKMIIAPFYDINIWFSLLGIVFILTASVLASLYFPPKKRL